jgi:hypothetical protein
MANRGTNNTDLSISITAGGTAQTIAPFNSGRRYLRISNPSTATESIWINDKGGTAVVGGGTPAPFGGMSWELGIGKAWEPNPPPINAVSVVAATTSHNIEACEG